MLYAQYVSGKERALMAWTLFNWGSRGLHYNAGNGVYVAQVLIPRAMQINLRGFDTYGNELLHVFGAVVASGAVGFSDCDAVAIAVANWASTSGGLKELIPTTFEIVDATVTARDVLNGPQATRIVGAVGTRAGDAAPGSVTLALKKAGEIAARWARGRFYTWPMVTTDYLENAFIGTYVAEAIASYNTLRTDLDAAGYPLVVLSNSHASAEPIQVILAVDSLVDCQRRRLSGRGS
jgi:hypothetical protein